MKRPFLILLIFAACGIAQEPGTDDCYIRRETWPGTMAASRARLHELAAPAGTNAFTSDIIRGRDDARRIEVDIRGFERLWLVAEDGGDGIGSDHSSWGEPELLDAQGNAVPLVDFKPVSTQIGWGRFIVNRDVQGNPIRVRDREFKTGFFAHARSRLLFDLAKIRETAGRDFTTLRVWIGIASTGRGHGSCQFRVLPGLDRESLADPLWDLVRRDFPEASDAFAAATGNRHRDWLLADDPAPVERAAVASILDSLEPHAANLRREFAQLDETRRLAFFQNCLELRTAVRQAEEVFGLARRTLDHIENLEPRPDLRAQFAELDGEYARLREQPDVPAERLAELVGRCRALRRATIFSHPELDFATLLISQWPPPDYSHMCDQYLGRRRRPGPGLVLLHDWKTNPRPQNLLADKLPEGVATKPDLSYDGNRILFSFSDTTEPRREHRRFLIYEYDLTTHTVRQVTGTPRDPMAGADGRHTVLIEDFDPRYLPDGGFVFVSTRCQSFGRCHGTRYTPAYLLYRGELDGTGIRQLSFGEANEWDPSILDDGRIIYTRWDYINRHDTFYQGLWTMRPDGTGTAHFYGSYTRNPCMNAEARAVPGSHRIISTAMAHHSYTAGSIVLIDPRRGVDGDEPIARLTPEIPFPETEGRPTGAFSGPFPLGEDLFLAAYTPDRLAFEGQVQRDEAYGIYLVDTLGGRELVFRDPAMSSHTPIPVRPRPQPPVLSSLLADLDQPTGSVYVQNVRHSTEALGELDIRSLRLNRIHLQPTRAKPALSRASNEILKEVVGTVAVDGNGAAAFAMPAGVPIQIQALDQDGLAVMTMRSFIYVQPGEYLSCVGCHEHRLSAPARTTATHAAVPTRPIQPPAPPRYEGGFSYARSVQPVFDRHCISCHGLGKAAGQLDLTGIPEHGYSRSHNQLVSKPGLVAIAYRNQETVRSQPRDYFAHAGKLAAFLAKGHQKVELDPGEFERIVTWLDLNAQYYGDYSHNRPENRRPHPEGEAALRAAIAARFGEELGKQPFHTLVNPALTSESRILLAPLPRAAGGWGQLADGAFAGREDPAFQAFQVLVENSLSPLAWEDRKGTCNRGDQCRCGCCWIEGAEDEYRRKIGADGKELGMAE